MENLDNPHEADVPRPSAQADPPLSTDDTGHGLPPEAEKDEPWSASAIDTNPTLDFQPYENVPTQPLVELKGVAVDASDDPSSWKFHSDYGSQRPEAVQLGERLGDWADQAGKTPEGLVGKLDTIAGEVNRQGLSQADAVTAIGVAMDRMHQSVGGSSGPVFEAENGSLVMTAPGLPVAFVIDKEGHATASKFWRGDSENPLAPRF